MLSLSELVFVAGTLVASFVVGLSGFAFSLVAAAIWLQVMPPAETTALMVAYALLVQGYAVWRVRHVIVPSRVWPFVAASAAGIPLGVLALRWLTPGQLRPAIAAFLILFSLYGLLRPRMPSVAWAGRLGDAAIGVLNGILGGSTGFGGILIVIWSSMRDWSPEEQRAVFQPVAVATFVMSLAAFGSAGLVGAATMRLFLLGLPFLVAGTAAGWWLYGRLDEAAFRRSVLWMLLASGSAMLLPGR